MVHVPFYVQRSLVSQSEKRGFLKIFKAYRITVTNAASLLSRITLVPNTKRRKRREHHPERRRPDLQTVSASAKHAKNADAQLTV